MTGPAQRPGGDGPATLVVAAGGGGDVIGAAMLAALAAGPGGPVHYASWSWDRLSVDPTPGPRGPQAFDGLRPVGRWNAAVGAASTPRAPYGSLLPKLASHLGIEVVLLDPEQGAAGLRRQLGELVGLLGVGQVLVVDVGGDVLARGGEPGLASPLADFLVLAATVDLPVPVWVVVAGLGVDGEVPAAQLRGYARELGGAVPWLRLDRAAVAAFGPVFEWHPSEATGLLWLAAMGERGVAEIRGDGLRVELDAHAADVHRFAHAAVLARNPAARALRATRSLAAAEARLVALGLGSELELERRKAATLGDAAASGALDVGLALDRLRAYERAAAGRGIAFLTMRRVGEVLGLSNEGLGQLRAALRRSRHPQYRPPVWLVASSGRL